MEKLSYDHNSYVSCESHQKLTFLKISSDLAFQILRSKEVKTAKNGQK